MHVFINEPLDLTGETHRLLQQRGIVVSTGRPMWERPHEPMSEDELIEAARGVDAIMGGSRDRYTRRLIEECPKLAIISKYGIGTERIDVQSATEYGVVVSHTPVPENYNAVAEHTIALTLALLRRLKSLDRHLREGGWRGPDTVVESLEGSTFGIVGLGRVGGAVAARLAAWNVRLIAYDPFVSENEAAGLRVELLPLSSLLEQADIVSLHVIVTPETRALIDADALARMKSTAVLVNTSRGELVDEEALGIALQRGRLAGAALDVFDTEPPEASNPLLRLANVVVSPHAAAFTARTIAAIVRCGADNLLRVAAGERPRFLKNPEVLQGALRLGRQLR